MSKEIVYPLTFAEHHYISSKGFIFLSKINLDRKILVPTDIDGDLYVNIYGKDHLLLDLILKYFFNHKKDFTSMTVNIKKGDKLIPTKSIRFENIESDPSEDYIVFKYKVAQKVTRANDRAYDMISNTDVVYALIKSDFKCRYCGRSINHKYWHLDHIVPLARKGTNHRDNLTPACGMCNIMKHAFKEDEFLIKCYKIYFNNREKVDALMDRANSSNNNSPNLDMIKL